MKKLATLLIGALAAFAAWAQDITEEQARTVAEYFVAKDAIGMGILPERTVDAVTRRGGLWLVTFKPSGHLFVSVNRSAEPIPSFSENDFVEPEVGSPQAALLALAETNSVNAIGTKYESHWRTMLGVKALRLATSSIKTAAVATYVNIEPMVQSTWTQNYPYNDLTPIVDGKSTLVGCVATAYSQILRFWEWPEVLDEDFVTEHTVDSLWGHKWRLKAGTVFDWRDMPLSDGYDYASRLKLGRGAMFAGMLARMKYNTEASGAQTAQPGQNRWYTAPNVLDTSNSELTDREEAMKRSLLNGCPFMVSVNYGTVGHAVVGDGWRESALGKYVHMNYGWGSTDNTYYTTSSALGVYLDAKPRPMVMNRPLATESALPVKVAWAFPKKGYDGKLERFDITFTEVAGATSGWTDNMEDPKGSVDGSFILIDEIGDRGDGNVLRIRPDADRAYYTWPTVVATDNTDFSYKVRSHNARNMCVEVQLFDQSMGWTTVSTPTVSDSGVLDWVTENVSLKDYAGKGIAIRVAVTSTGSHFSDVNDKAVGVQLDDITFTNIRESLGVVAGTVQAAADVRTASVDDTVLKEGSTYLFQVKPVFNDDTVGIPNYSAACKISASNNQQPTITTVTSVRSGVPAVQNNMYRECYFGLNQFGVYGSEATTKLEAYLSNLAVIDQDVPFWDTVFNEWATGKGLRSLDGVVSVDTKSAGNFLVKVNASQLTDYLNGVGMILTLIARNNQGDAVQKDVYLEFTKTGTEQELAVADLPENGGTIPSEEEEEEDDLGDEPDEPSGDDPVAEPSNGNANDFTEGGVTYRFCNGVDKTSGFKDVSRVGYQTYQAPAAYNLVLWWAEAYKAENGNYPNGYTAPDASSLPNDNTTTIEALAAKLFKESVSTAMPTEDERAQYFPTVSSSASDWYGTAAGDAMVKAIGKKIFAALDKGPIGIMVPTSSTRTYGAVIWGCEYADDDDGKYAKVIYFTSTKSNGDDLENATLANVAVSGVGTMPGLQGFNTKGGVITTYYPIIGPASSGSEPDPEPEPDDPVTPDPDPQPDTPAEDEPIAEASDAGNEGKSYQEEYGYEMYDNYWTARKRAIKQGKQLFVLSGASWCSNCAFVKNYLTTLGKAFTDKFVVYYSNHDDAVTSPYFHGGLPQYGAADPRKTDAFTGTLDGTTRTWESVWTTMGCGIYKQDRGGYAADRVNTVVAAGQAKAAYGYPTELVIRGLSTLAAGYAGQYELYARFSDGVEMPVDHGVTWSVVSGKGTLEKADVDGREVTALTIASGDVVLRAKSTYYFTGSKTITVKSTDLSKVDSVAINTTTVNLEDDATPLLEAVATMKDGSEIAVVGFGNWSAKFKERISRTDSDLEEENQSPVISFDGNSRLTYAKTNGRLEVCDQKIDVTLTVNGKSVTKEITVWGPTKVVPSKWTVISGPRQTHLGVVRLQCTELKYNYGGQIYTTKDTYFASYKTVLKQGSSTVETSLRGLTAYAFSEQGGTCRVGLAATKANGKFTGYTPSDPTTSKLATNFTNVVKGSVVTDMTKGAVPTGFFNAFFPSRSDYAKLADEDSDGDGFKNWEEYVLGTDPTNRGDAFTLMQGYQHLAAPAASGDTMQYKVMYQQRARRIYYIEAKKTWAEDWTPVATMSLANAAEGDVTSFTELNASYADGAKFFRVRASLYEHVFNDPSNAPKITPNMLVAAPGAIIDLSSEKLPLDLSSFDTDATDAGTVHVKVSSGVAAGTALIRAPKLAKTSLEACKPYESGDVAFEVVTDPTDAEHMILRVKLPAPTIEGGDGKGSVQVTDEEIVVTPAENVTEITIDNPGERKVAIPPSVAKIGGVTDSGKIVIKSGSHDITKAMKFTPDGGGFRVELNAEAKVTIGKEEIPVRPELASGSSETPFEVQDGQLVFNVKSIPGLKYKVLASDTLDPNGFGTTAQETGAESSRCELRVDQPSGKKRGFYKIQVSR